MKTVDFVLAQGRVGVVDAALVRWLTHIKAGADCLGVRITQSIFEPVLPKIHLENLLLSLEAVDRIYAQSKFSSEVEVMPLPEADLLDYSMGSIRKSRPVVECESDSTKLTTLEDLGRTYGSRPPRQKTVGMVSGAFDLIHPGHVSMIHKAKTRVDYLIVLAMSSSAIKQQEKNLLGDRPIYSTCDRVEVLAALRDVDYVVVFDGLNCLESIKTFCPDYFFKSIDDRKRPVVQAETDLVNLLGGRSFYLEECPREYSSTSIIEYIQRHPGV